MFVDAVLRFITRPRGQGSLVWYLTCFTLIRTPVCRAWYGDFDPKYEDYCQHLFGHHMPQAGLQSVTQDNVMSFGVAGMDTGLC